MRASVMIFVFVDVFLANRREKISSGFDMGQGEEVQAVLLLQLSG